MRIDFPGITVTAATLILEELFTKKGFNPGDGTIKKYIADYFKKTPHLSIENWDGDPMKLCHIGTLGTIDGEEIIGGVGSLPWTRSGISAALERKIASIRLAADEAIKRAERSAERAKMFEKYLLEKREILKEKWDKAKSKHT